MHLYIHPSFQGKKYFDVKIIIMYVIKFEILLNHFICYFDGGEEIKFDKL